MARLSMLPSTFGTVSASGMKAFAVQWLAYAHPYRRFADILADACARLGADVDRYSFTVRDLHPRLLAGFAGALRETCTTTDVSLCPSGLVQAVL